MRAWSLSYLGLFTIKSFFVVLSNHSNQVSFFTTNFVWKSQVLKVKAFAWLLAHKKVNTNNMLQLRRSYKTLSLDVCMLCMERGELVDHLFVHHSLTIGLWHKLFRFAKLDRVPPMSIYDMVTIAFKGLGNSSRGLVLWQTTYMDLIWVVCHERNARIF